MKIPGLLGSLQISASGLTAQRIRIDTIATNIANAQTTRTAQGGPYRRQVVELNALPGDPRVPFNQSLRTRMLGTSKERHFATGMEVADAAATPGGVEVAGVVEDAAEGPLVYDPGHPDADENGYVRYPNVDATTEMVDLLISRRVYEANATAFEAAKNMIRRAIEI